VPPEEEGLGGFGFPDEVLRRAVAGSLGAGSDADASDSIRFQRGVVKVVRRRRARHGVDAETAPSVFFLCSRPESISESDTSEEPMLDNGRAELGQRLWFVGPPCASGVCHELAEWADAAVFTLAIEKLGLGDVPAVVVDPRDERLELRWYSAGLRMRDTYEPLHVGGERIDIDHIVETIGRIYKHSLLTPTALGRGRRAWKNATKFWVSDEAEYIIEGCLQSSLAEAYPSCDVRKEQDMPVGRSDLEIHEADFDESGGWTSHAVLELKVLRSYRSTGTAVSRAETAEHVREGVLQAYEYRDHKRAEAGALCCFDMRRVHEDCFAVVQQLAHDQAVRLASWPMFNSPKAYRVAQAAST
jgi:hypothetical protein